jgi:hypothetical protein
MWGLVCARGVERPAAIPERLPVGSAATGSAYVIEADHAEVLSGSKP